MYILHRLLISYHIFKLYFSERVQIPKMSEKKEDY